MPRPSESVVALIPCLHGGACAPSLLGFKNYVGLLYHLPRSPPPIHVEFVGDASSEITSSSWTMASIPTPPPTPASKQSISFCPVPHSAESFTEYDRLQVRSDENPSFILLRGVAPEKSQLCSELLHTSLPSSRDAMRDIIPHKNGFVDTVIEAYNNHRGLIVRPDDIWIAIMTQFSFFVNGHAEALRKVFVTHEGKRELVVESSGSRYTMDTASMVDRMTALMEEQIDDPSLRDWIMPDFTTTTPVDKTACAIVMMGAMKNYFAYKFTLRCGIPKVTLEGEKKDWESILHRLEHLKRYGIQTIAWYHLLRPILTRFVTAYDHPTHPDNLDFWNRIAHRELGAVHNGCQVGSLRFASSMNAVNGRATRSMKNGSGSTNPKNSSDQPIRFN
ncbi:hypothetical protein JVT61DRAFT_8944 [Boletus reticuloceps]|uniref:Uncharacterized protein n=1 Tax=Boletus reticuloceps TaxID=495285 RepID=A0A8I2YGT1_9AGAM|nr:hypothetical protein JVT61DRAFT_8944 [Boletus reticuloceps]